LELVAQCRGDRDAAPARAGFWGDEARFAVPASPDVDQVSGQVDIVPLQRLEFAEVEAGVQCGRVDGAVGGLEGVEERGDLGWRRDPFALAAHDRECQLHGWVDGDIAAAVGAPEDRTQRQDRVADTAR
jgi:hypothetical protein